MTTKRWIDETSEAEAFERAVLSSGLEAGPPPGAERVIWRDLLAALPPVVPLSGAESIVPAATTAGGAAKGVATVATLAKGFAVGVGVSLAVAGGTRFIGGSAPDAGAPSVARLGTATSLPTTRRPAPPLVPAPELPVAAPESVVATPPSTAPIRSGEVTSPAGASPTSPAPATPIGVAPATPAGSVAAFPVPAQSRLEEEAALLNRARSELHAGHLAQAFATLEASRERFSAPELHQEREALTIELLYRSGQRAQAVVRAERFLAQHPESPHVAKIRNFTR
jgi:hypothetical protein